MAVDSSTAERAIVALLVVLADQAEEELFQIVFMIAVAQFFQRSLGQDAAAVHDGDAIAEFFGFAHDVGRKDDALALVAQLGHGA